jgi:hypothetical protein
MLAFKKNEYKKDQDVINLLSSLENMVVNEKNVLSHSMHNISRLKVDNMWDIDLGTIPVTEMYAPENLELGPFLADKVRDAVTTRG